MTTSTRACVYNDPEPTVILVRPSNATRLDDLSAVLDAFWPLVRPACAGCEVDAEAGGVASSTISDGDAHAPPEVNTTGAHLVSRVREIEKRHLLDAFAALLERHSGRMRFLDFVETKARVFLAPGEQVMLRGVSAPLVRRDGTTFAIGPTESFGVPLSFSMVWGRGRLDLVLRMHWSLWSEPGEPEHEALRACFDSLIRDGWEVDVASHAFRTLIPR